jgi:prepilin-type N-terminal cleavage/methylation domain-containing protein
MTGKRSKTDGSSIWAGNAGFSLVEVLVALGISAVVAWAILNLQINQSKTAAVQSEVVAMQQGLRGSMTLLAKELKKAGYKGDKGAPAGIVAVNANGSLIHYTTDSDSDGNVTGATEHAAFCFANNTLRFTEGNSSAVGNHPSHGHLDVMADLQQMEFRYQLADSSWTLAPAPLTDIRMIQVTLLGRTRTADPNYKNTTSYTFPSGAVWGPYNDGFRRQMLTTTIALWNMAP